MRKISVLNYGCGNLLSIERSIKEVGYDAKIIENNEEIEKAEFLVLPGVGAFNNAMSLLKNKNLIEKIKNYALVKKKTNFRDLPWDAIVFFKEQRNG